MKLDRITIAAFVISVFGLGVNLGTWISAPMTGEMKVSMDPIEINVETADTVQSIVFCDHDCARPMLDVECLADGSVRMTMNGDDGGTIVRTTRVPEIVRYWKGCAP